MCVLEPGDIKFYNEKIRPVCIGKDKLTKEKRRRGKGRGRGKGHGRGRGGRGRRGHHKREKEVPSGQEDFHPTVLTVGWGKMEDGEIANQLMKLPRTLLSDGVCKAEWKRQFDPSTMLCTSNSGGRDQCEGDSGSGWFQVDQTGGPNNDTRWHLIGLTSFGAECGSNFGVGAELTKSVTNWILKSTRTKTFDNESGESGSNFKKPTTKNPMLMGPMGSSNAWTKRLLQWLSWGQISKETLVEMMQFMMINQHLYF